MSDKNYVWQVSRFNIGGKIDFYKGEAKFQYVKCLKTDYH
jgi:hypothetical protein